MTYVGSGWTIGKATAVAVTPVPYDTQQIGVDNSVIPGMRAAVGVTKSPGSAQIVS